MANEYRVTTVTGEVVGRATTVSVWASGAYIEIVGRATNAPVFASVAVAEIMGRSNRPYVRVLSQAVEVLRTITTAPASSGPGGAASSRMQIVS